MAKRKAQQPLAVGGMVNYQINDHWLNGVSNGKGWDWNSSVPGLVGVMPMDEAIDKFTKHALAGAVAVKRLAKGGGDG